ncbi:hypothetical protein RHGRI_015235 [Rhododendron griersonianum]|uniref:Uncharacterized protein n=1 Tax=Rhododendron griersonianum TaxID=479676 RepID=A0AAV6KCY2_9ERIC|nr:hypothetical protein RHGRI_015235 [Rhododendron griersonianum]
MTSPITYPVDDKDLDDAALWAVIDSAAAASLSSSTKSRKPLSLKHNHSPIPFSLPKNPSPPPNRFVKTPRNNPYSSPPNHNFRALTEGEVIEDPCPHQRPQKMARSCVSELSEASNVSPLVMVKHAQRMPSYSSPESRGFSVPSGSECSPLSYGGSRGSEEKENVRQHSLSGQFPSVSLFKEYQNAAMAILEKSDYTMISGSPFIKKTGWRKISFYFNLSFEIKDKTIEFDENRNVLRAEFVVRAYMQGGRFSDGWGSCERREKRFLKPNHDIPSTAETRAKNKACQDHLKGKLRGSRWCWMALTAPGMGLNFFSRVLSLARVPESTGSFFRDRSITLGSLMGVSSILELSRRSMRGRPSENLRGKKNWKSKPWLFSLCSKLNTDAVSMSNGTPSLGHFLESERRAATTYRRNPGPVAYGPDDFSQDPNSLFVGGHIAPAQSSSWLDSNGERRSSRDLLENGNGYGAPLLLSCLCGQLIE